jgi:hypothetical protein
MPVLPGGYKEVSEQKEMKFLWQEKVPFHLVRHKGPLLH